MEKRVEKVWGRSTLPGMFGASHPGSGPIGEIWFQNPSGRDDELLVKYLFTSQRLSIQVHPDDRLARAVGQPRGKDEAWFVLDSDPDAAIGLGLRRAVTKDALRASALDGSIVDLVDWRAASAGDAYYSPAGTVHALGSGLTVVEVQQNTDLTYRLYDYGRPRELHLDQGVAAANTQPYVAPARRELRNDGREICASGAALVLERWASSIAATVRAPEDRPVWLIPVRGSIELGGQELAPGTVWLLEGAEPIAIGEGSELLVAYAGAEVLEDLLDE